MSLFEHCKLVQESALQSHNLLAENKHVTFFGIPHESPAFQVSVKLAGQSLEELQQFGAVRSLSEQVEQPTCWDLARASHCKSEPLRLCQLEGSCWCSRHMLRHRQMLRSVTKGIKGVVADMGLSDDLYNSNLVFKWEFCRESAVPTCVCTLVALQYLRPWRPVFLRLQMLQGPQGRLRLQLPDGDLCELFSTLEMLMREFDTSQSLDVSAHLLSSQWTV